MANLSSTVARHREHRATIFLETAEILSHQAHPGEQFTLRIAAPKMAGRAQPGQFAHIRCDAELPMRRPMSIMDCDPDTGWVEFLYKRTGHGTSRLSQLPPGTGLSVLGPIGTGFTASASRAPLPLLVGGGVGIPPIAFLAHRHREICGPGASTPLVLMGSEVPFPFDTANASVSIRGIPQAATRSIAALHQKDIPSRLASRQDYEGCYLGHVTELAERWLESCSAQERRRVQIYACGPHPMLVATAALGRAFDVPCQVCLEEYMACAVGGCAGCVVRVQTAQGPAMKRVCVDGPVFDARHVVW